MQTDLTRTLADIALGPKPAAPRKDPPYDGWYTTDWEGITYSVPYWIANERDLATEMADITLGPPGEWRLLGMAAGVREAIEDTISETVDEDYRSSRVDDPCDRRREEDLT